jgi:YVTN family beta-propeller protein
MRRFIASLFVLFLTVTTVPAQTTPKASLLALSKKDHTLAIIDPATLQTIATVPVGDDPHEVVASADGKFAYVSNYGFGSLHTLTVIDLVEHKQVEQIDLGALTGPHGLEFKNGKVWFTAEGAKAIGSYDPATKKIDWIMGTGQDRTHMIYVFHDGKRILTTNVNSATVTLMEHYNRKADPNSTAAIPRQMPLPPGGDWKLTVIPVGRGAEGFDVSPNGKEAWVANAQDGTISIINLATRKVTTTLKADVRGANRLKFTPDGKIVLVSAGTELVAINSLTRKEIKRFKVVHAGGGIQMQPDGKRAYVACGRDGFVAAIDLKMLEMVGKVDITGPDGLAWAVQQ